MGKIEIEIVIEAGQVDMTNGKTIVFCCNSGFGLVNFRGAAIRALLDAGHKVVVVSPRDAYVEQLCKLGASFEEWAVKGGGTGMFGEARAIRELFAIYRRVRPNVVFHFTIKPVIYGALAARLLCVPFVSVITGLGYSFLNRNRVSRIARLLYRVTLRWSREVWFLNDDDRQVFIDAGLIRNQTIRVLPGEGVDSSHYFPMKKDRSPDDVLVFLMIARLLLDKGAVEYIEAAKILLSRGVKARFQILGEVDSNNPSAIPRDTLESWRKSGLVEYLGVVRDVRNAIAAADCIVLPSYREGVPRCLLEAASMERPVITTDVPGCRNVILPGVTGVLCKARDVESLAAAMMTFAATPPDLREKMGRAGRTYVEKNFDERLVVPNYFEVVDRLTRDARVGSVMGSVAP